MVVVMVLVVDYYTCVYGVLHYVNRVGVIAASLLLCYLRGLLRCFVLL